MSRKQETTAEDCCELCICGGKPEIKNFEGHYVVRCSEEFHYDYKWNMSVSSKEGKIQAVLKWNKLVKDVYALIGKMEVMPEFGGKDV